MSHSLQASNSSWTFAPTKQVSGVGNVCSVIPDDRCSTVHPFRHRQAGGWAFRQSSLRVGLSVSAMQKSGLAEDA